jgi:Tol biopolymer transport system component
MIQNFFLDFYSCLSDGYLLRSVMKVKRYWVIFVIAALLLVQVGCSEKTQTSVDPHEESPISTDSFTPNGSHTPSIPIPSTLSTPTITPTVTTSPTSIPAGTNNFAVAFSENGRYLAFNTNISSFIYDTQQHITEPGGIFPPDSVLPSNTARSISLSEDGRFLLFGAMSNSLDPLETHYNYVFLRDREAATTRKIDLSDLDRQWSAYMYSSLSPNGRYLALLAQGDHLNLYLYEISSGQFTPATGKQEVQPSDTNIIGSPTFSPDNRYLAYVSTATLVAGETPCKDSDPYYCGDVFLYNIASDQLERIPAGIRLSQGYSSPHLAISSEAHWIAWSDVEEPYRPVVRLYNRQTRQTETVCAGELPNCTGHSPSISSDGRWLAFATFPQTGSDNSGLPGLYSQVYLLDRQTNTLTLVSADQNGESGDGNSGMISLQQEGFSSDVQISGNGGWVAFASQAGNLLPQWVEKRQCYDPTIVGGFPCYDLFVYNNQTKVLNWIGQQK